MNNSRLNQKGFSTVIIALALLVFGVMVFIGLKVFGSNKSVNYTQGDPATGQVAPIAAGEQKILVQAKELKKIDFDLDGRTNSLDTDDDNDGQSDDIDKDDDNDGVEDDEDKDDDNDGVEDDKDDEEKQESELQSSN